MPETPAPLLATDTPDGRGDPSRLSEWLAQHLPASVTPPLRYELIAAGGSNLTYRVSDAASNRWALRRPPMAHTLATAHDMAREWRIMSALGDYGAGAGTGTGAGPGARAGAGAEAGASAGPDAVAVPVPKCLAFCEDTDLIGAPFYVMSFVDGLILRDQSSAASLSPTQALAATHSLVDIQVAMHTLDLKAAGLADLGRHDNYVGRQLKRWRRQVVEGGVREPPLHQELHRLLSEKMPPERARPALAHGDYRFDNCVLGADHRIVAVLDWELCTTGDPIADFVWSLQYWGDPSDPLTFLPDPPTFSPAFMRREEYRRLYEERSGFDLGDLGYYQIFSWWKQASIVEGAYARRLAGAGGGMAGGPGDSAGQDVDSIARRVDEMLRMAAEWAEAWL